MRTTTHRMSGGATPGVIAALVEFGFELDEARRTTTTLLDTPDGRLHRAGLRLELREDGLRELVLTRPSQGALRTPVDGTVRMVDDLPDGPLHDLLAPIVDVRALLPVLRLSATRRSGRWRDDEGRELATVELAQRIRLLHPRGRGAPATTIELTPLTKRGRAGRTLLDGLGLERSATDTIAQCAAAAGVVAEGLVAPSAVALDPDMPSIDGFRAVLADLAGAITTNWQGTLDQTDTEFLHDLRIALRRTRTVLGEARGVIPPAARDPARDGFAWLARLTGPARDLDVYVMEWPRYTDPLGPDAAPALRPVLDLLEQRRRAAHTELEQALGSPRARALLDGWAAWLDEDPGRRAEDRDGDGPDGHAGRPLGRLVARRIDRAHRTVVDNGRLITPASPPEQLHELRKDAKRLRYLLECFGGLLADGPRERFVKRLRSLQDNLGAHQDAEVHEHLLRDIARELHAAGVGPDTMVAIGQLTERLDQQRLAARDEFATRFAGFDTTATRRALDAVLDPLR